MAFIHDGTRLATASADNTVRLWSIFSNADELITYAKDDKVKPRESDGYTVKPRELTRDECEQYFLPCQ